VIIILSAKYIDDTSVWVPLTRPAACFVGAGKEVFSTPFSRLSSRSADMLIAVMANVRLLNFNRGEGGAFGDGRMTAFDLVQGGKARQNKVGF